MGGLFLAAACAPAEARPAVVPTSSLASHTVDSTPASTDVPASTVESPSNGEDSPPTTVSFGPLTETQLFVQAGPQSPTVLLVGDSSMAGLRWYDGVAGRLVGANYILDVESCRRVVRDSCRGREGRLPSTVAEVVAASAPNSVDVLVVMAGYNDDGSDFAAAVGTIGELAAARGIDDLVWVRFSRPNPAATIVDTSPHNSALEQVMADSTAPRWSIADWPSFALGAQDVFEIDGIHLTRSGAEHLAEFVSVIVARVLDPSCDLVDAQVCALGRAFLTPELVELSD